MREGRYWNRWTDDEIAVLRELVRAGGSREGVPIELGRRFGRLFTYWAVVSKASQLGLVWRTVERRIRQGRTFWDTERANWLRAHYRDGTAEQVSAMASSAFGVEIRVHQVQSAAHRLGLTKRQPQFGGLRDIEIDAIRHRRGLGESIENLAECFEVELEVIERVLSKKAA